MSLELNYEDTGKASGSTLLLIHPLGADLRFWDDCVALWREQFRCIACDLPSAGRSPSSAEAPTIDIQRDAILGLLDRLGAQRVVAIGTAVGALAAIALAQDAPDRVAGLVVTNPGIFIGPAARAALVDRIERLKTGGMAAILPDAVDKPFNGLRHDDRYRAYLNRFAGQDPKRYAHAIRGILDADVRDRLDRVRCPTLILSAEHEALMDPAHAAALQEAVPGAEAITLEAASHFLPYQAPRRFAALASAFVHEGVEAHDATRVPFQPARTGTATRR